MLDANKSNTNSLSSSEVTLSRSSCSSKRQISTSKMSMEFVEIPSINPQAQAPQECAGRYPGNFRYFHLCLETVIYPKLFCRLVGTFFLSFSDHKSWEKRPSLLKRWMRSLQEDDLTIEMQPAPPFTNPKIPCRSTVLKSPTLSPHQRGSINTSTQIN